MEKVRVQKEWLKAIVAKNREGHSVEFEKAFAGYRAECIRLLEDNLDAFKTGKRFKIVWSEVPPENHTKDYDRVISMLDASVDDTIELSGVEFAQFVQDDWQWRERWSVSNSKYLAGK